MGYPRLYVIVHVIAAKCRWVNKITDKKKHLPWGDELGKNTSKRVHAHDDGKAVADPLTFDCFVQREFELSHEIFILKRKRLVFLKMFFKKRKT